MLRRVSLAAVFIALIVVVRLFPDRNENLVDVDLLFTTVVGIELWFALGASLVAGSLLALLVSALFLIKSGLVGRRYRKAIADLEAEVHHLRNLPLASGDLIEDAPSVSGESGGKESAKKLAKNHPVGS